MRLIMNAINKGFLQDILYKSKGSTKKVIAAVAYATDANQLFKWCLDNKIPLKYYGRLDAGVAVSPNILSTFHNKNSADFVCKLIRHHHAKVIWWQGYGVYIGSANLTSSAWVKNIEVGCFFLEEEINADMKKDLFALFDKLDKYATPLNDEVIEEMQKRFKILKDKENISDEKKFYEHPSFTKWDGLGVITNKKPKDKKQDAFVKEWHATLDDLRKIGERVSQPENRPKWVSDKVLASTHADQFLQAHYYQRVVKGNTSYHEDFFEKNKNRREYALMDAMEWWRNLSKAPDREDIMLNDTAPFLQKTLSQEILTDMDESTFHEVCGYVHAILNYARRAPNKSVNLPSNEYGYNDSQKIKALAKTIWNDQSSGGKSVKELLNFILYGGEDDELSKRLWQGFNDPTWKIKGLDIGSLGEIVGWARPDKFPPRNGRTSKALRSLGYDVEIDLG